MKELEILKLLYNSKPPLDDCFLLNNQYLITTDTITEGTHFKHEWSSAKQIAIKLIETNISDIASSGGKKGWVFLNLGLSKISSEKKWLKEFVFYFKKYLSLYELILSGGDTYRSSKTTLNLTILSNKLNYYSREFAKAEDKIYITGALGFSNWGYKLLKNKIKPKTKLERIAIKKHLEPRSRYFESLEITRSNKIHSMMDITDGLVQDSAKFASACNLDFYIELDQLPFFETLRQNLKIEDIIHSGEELELLILTDQEINSQFPLHLNQIGYAKKGNGKVHFTLNGVAYFPQKKGFIHFNN